MKTFIPVLSALLLLNAILTFANYNGGGIFTLILLGLGELMIGLILLSFPKAKAVSQAFILAGVLGFLIGFSVCSVAFMG